MADITLTSVVDGTLANPAVIEQNFYTPSVAGTGSLEAVNGHLDNANRQAGWDIDRSQIQEGALSSGKGIGGNMNLDYFGDVFNGWAPAADTWANRVRNKQYYQAIPGASITFYLPYQVTALVISYCVYFGGKGDQLSEDGTAYQNAIGDYGNEVGRIEFYLDGMRTGSATKRTNLAMVPPKGLTSSDNMLGSWDRAYSGYKLITSGTHINAGWHSASLRVVTRPSNGQATLRPNNQVRVRGRHMNYVYFR